MKIESEILIYRNLKQDNGKKHTRKRRKGVKETQYIVRGIL